VVSEISHIADMEPEALIAEIDAFCSKTGMAPTTFGSRALNDRGLVADLRTGGRECKPSTAKRILAFINHYEAEQQQGAA
jgi:hypothetical protein